MENKNWTKDKIEPQHLHECAIKTSIWVAMRAFTSGLKGGDS